MWGRGFFRFLWLVERWDNTWFIGVLGMGDWDCHVLDAFLSYLFHACGCWILLFLGWFDAKVRIRGWFNREKLNNVSAKSGISWFVAEGASQAGTKCRKVNG